MAKIKMLTEKTFEKDFEKYKKGQRVEQKGLLLYWEKNT